MRFIDEHDDGRRAGLYLVNDRAQTVFKFALHGRTSLQQTHVQHQKADVAQRRGNIAARNAQREPFDNGGFTDTGFTGQDRVVLPATHQYVDDLANFFVTANNRVDFAVTGLFGQVCTELIQRLAAILTRLQGT